MIADSMHTTTRPGLPWGGFSFSHVPMPSSSFPPLVWPPTVSRRHFCARVQRGRGEAKTQNLRKGHLQARKAALPSCSVPIFPLTKTAHSGPHSATQGIKRPRPTPSESSRGIVLYGRLQRVNFRPECCNPCADRVRPSLLHDLPDCFTVCIFPAVAVCRLCCSFAAGRNHHLIALHRIVPSTLRTSP